MDKTCHTERYFEEMADESTPQKQHAIEHGETRGKVSRRVLLDLRIDIRSMRNAMGLDLRGTLDKVLSL